MLIDREILAALGHGDLTVSPDDGIATRVQPASLDVRLGSKLRVLDKRQVGIIDPKVDQSSTWRPVEVHSGDAFVVQPNELVLASTLELIGLSETLLARVEGKSSLGRLGILVHATAGYIDPGWPLANITLEISTVTGVPTKLYPGMPIAQLAFQRVQAVASGYSGKYAGQQGPVASQYHQNWTGSRWI